MGTGGFARRRSGVRRCGQQWQRWQYRGQSISSRRIIALFCGATRTDTRRRCMKFPRASQGSERCLTWCSPFLRKAAMIRCWKWHAGSRRILRDFWGCIHARVSFNQVQMRTLPSAGSRRPHNLCGHHWQMCMKRSPVCHPGCVSNMCFFAVRRLRGRERFVIPASGEGGPYGRRRPARMAE